MHDGILVKLKADMPNNNKKEVGPYRGFGYQSITSDLIKVIEKQ